MRSSGNKFRMLSLHPPHLPNRSPLPSNELLLKAFQLCSTARRLSVPHRLFKAGNRLRRYWTRPSCTSLEVVSFEVWTVFSKILREAIMDQAVQENLPVGQAKTYRRAMGRLSRSSDTRRRLGVAGSIPGRLPPRCAGHIPQRPEHKQHGGRRFSAATRHLPEA